jgi:predicted transcriptional regulator
MGKSVRYAVNYLANNNSVTALRLQNKYRNLLKTNPTLIEKVKKELGIKEKKVEERDSLRHFNQFQILRVKKEINNLLDKTLDELKRENVALKNKVKELEEKIVELSNQNLIEKQKSPLEFFVTGKSV